MGFSVYGNKGVTHWEKGRAFEGVTLYSTIGSGVTRLVNMNGETVHTWTPPAPAKPFYGFLRDNGNLLVRCYDGSEPYPFGGFGGVLVELDWDSNVVWRYDNPVIHHDHTVLRNGNIMVIGWEELTDEQESQVRGGRERPRADGASGDPLSLFMGDGCDVSGLWTPADVRAHDRMLGPGAHDDLAGDGSGVSTRRPPRGEGRPHGMLSDFLLELTPDGKVVWEWHGKDKLEPTQDVICPLEFREEWTHCNSVLELADGNICLSFRHTSQLVFINKATGEVTWRFGPGELSHQHNPTQLANGNLLVFDNGEHRAQGGIYSRVVEIDPATNEIVWQFRGDPSLSFFSTGISGAQRLPNGNTFICDGRTGRLFEVTPEGAIVWEYMNPELCHWRGEDLNRAVFRALRYAVDSPEVQGRV